jgi:mono/diheme cytochrome c family protein
MVRLLLLLAFTILISIQNTYPQIQGESIFVQTCKTCHTIGQGKLIGPDLYDVHNRRSENWIKRFIKSSQSVINSGDETAVNLFNEFNRSVMPDQPLSDDEIKEILIYIEDQTTKVNLAGGPVIAIPKPVLNSEGKTLDEADENDYQMGKDLFSGKDRLANGGAACISCHNVFNNEVIGGGLLGLDLTTAFTRLNGSGVNTIISNSPFPVMQYAYINQRVSQDEAYYLTVFLKQTDSLYTTQQPLSSDNGFVLSGIIGVVVLFSLYGGMWWNRKRKPDANRLTTKFLKDNKKIFL